MISLIIAALNEEKTIGKVIGQAKKYVDEIIVVSDSSTDRTAEIARNLGAKVIINEKRLGQMKSIRRALKHVKNDIIITMDADGEHNPKDIPKLVDKLKRYDIAIGSRKHLPRFAERVYSFIFKKKIGISDMMSNFRAFKKECKNIHFRSAYLVEFLLKARKAGFKISEVKIKSKRRKDSRLGSNFVVNIKYLLILPRILLIL